jgi:carbon-monoxide dehydrogenase large subunit
VSLTTRPRLVGERVLRREDPKYLVGRGRYVDDIELPGMLHAAFVRSPHAHADVGQIDAGAALGLRGIHAVITGHDVRAATTGPMAYVATLPRDDTRTCVQHVLPLGRVRFVGEPIAIVVADSRALAEDGAEMVEVDWTPRPAVTSNRQALAAGAPIVHDDIPDNNFAHIEYCHGDVAGAFAGADHVFRKKFEVGRSSSAPLECRGVVAAWHAATGEGEIWSSAQAPHTLHSFVARLTGVPKARLRCHAPDIGGGFGCKGACMPEDPALLVAAKILERPLKWIEDRVEHLTAAPHGRQLSLELELAVAGNGRFLAMRAHIIGDAGAYALLPPTPLVDGLEAAAFLPSVYDIPAVSYVVDCPFTNKSPSAAARGVGWVGGQLVRELLIDEAARALSTDPADLRIFNCLPGEPHTSATGLPYDGGSYVESMRQVVELAGYAELRAEQQRLRSQGRYTGIGFSPFMEANYSTAHARAAGYGIATYDSLSVSVDVDGSVVIRTAFHSHGQGHETTFAQLAADVLDVPLDRVRVLMGDTDTGTFGMGTFGSRTAVIASELITLAGRDVREKLVAFAAHLLGSAASDIVVTEGVFSVRDDAERAIPLVALASAIYFGGPETRPQGLEPVLSSTRYCDPPACYTNGAIVALVEVDPESGIVEPRHIWLTEDCGKVLNPLILEGQLTGGLAQGIGAALLEELVYDEHGQLTTATLMDYLYPLATDVPGFTLSHIESLAATSLGAKGAGEGGTVAGSAAIVQAVVDALTPFGARATRAPLSPSDVVDMIDAPPPAR